MAEFLYFKIKEWNCIFLKIGRPKLHFNQKNKQVVFDFMDSIKNQNLIHIFILKNTTSDHFIKTNFNVKYTKTCF